MIVSLHTPPKWKIFKLAALNRAAKLLRHLPPTPLSYPSPRKPVRDAVDDGDVEEFYVFEVEEIVFKVRHIKYRNTA